MSLWLSGIVFLFCCELMSMPSEADWCPLAQRAAAHCDREKAENSSDSIIGSDSEGASECRLITTVFDKTRKVERDTVHSRPVDKVAQVSANLPYAANGVVPRKFYTSYHPPGNKIFVKHQVFRI